MSKNQIEIDSPQETKDFYNTLEQLNVSSEPNLKVVLNKQFSFINK
jgi:hypothetical protein